MYCIEFSLTLKRPLFTLGEQLDFTMPKQVPLVFRLPSARKLLR